MAAPLPGVPISSKIEYDTKAMKCSNCGSEFLDCRVGDHSYVEARLEHVLLRDVEIRRCASCEETSVVLPALTRLHDAIAREIIEQPRFLLGPEVEFLRKRFDYTLEQLAEELGTSEFFIKAWEANGRNPKANPDDNVGFDRMLRLWVHRELEGAEKPWWPKRLPENPEQRTTIEARLEGEAWVTQTVPVA